MLHFPATQRNVPQEQNPQYRRCENLRSRKIHYIGSQIVLRYSTRIGLYTKLEEIFGHCLQSILILRWSTPQSCAFWLLSYAFPKQTITCEGTFRE